MYQFKIDRRASHSPAPTAARPLLAKGVPARPFSAVCKVPIIKDFPSIRLIGVKVAVGAIINKIDCSSRLGVAGGTQRSAIDPVFWSLTPHFAFWLGRAIKAIFREFSLVNKKQLGILFFDR